MAVGRKVLMRYKIADSELRKRIEHKLVDYAEDYPGLFSPPVWEEGGGSCFVEGQDFQLLIRYEGGFLTAILDLISPRACDIQRTLFEQLGDQLDLVTGRWERHG